MWHHFSLQQKHSRSQTSVPLDLQLVHRNRSGVGVTQISHPARFLYTEHCDFFKLYCEKPRKTKQAWHPTLWLSLSYKTRKSTITSHQRKDNNKWFIHKESSLSTHEKHWFGLYCCKTNIYESGNVSRGLWCESMFIFSSMSMMQLYMCAPFVSYNLHLTVLTHLSWIWIKSFITLEKEENMPSSAPQTPRIMKSYLSLSWKNKIKTISWKWIHDFCHTQTAMCEYFLCTYYYIHC